MGGKGSTTITAPEAVDPGKAMGEYLFGRNFTSFEGITDPILQERIMAAERAYRPEYTALELADIGTMAQGLEERANPERQRLEAELAAVRAGNEIAASGITTKEMRKTLEEKANRLFPPTPRPSRTMRGYVYKDNNKGLREAFVQQGMTVSTIGDREERAAKIAELETRIEQMPETLKAQPGLFDLLEDQSRRAGALQREQLGLQRAEDVAALQEFAPQVVEAYRGADPYSTRLAELSQAQAERAFARAEAPMTEEERRAVEQSVLARSGIDPIAQADRSAVEMALGRRGARQQQEQYAAGLGQQSFAQQRALAGDLGATILGRPSSAINLGQSQLGMAQAGAAGQMGPQLFDPNAGVNLAMAQRSDDISLLGAQAQADAARSAGSSSMFGSIAGGIIGAIPFCWVAREVYGEENPKWQLFRDWMLNEAPCWFRNLYIQHGERFAKFISNKPKFKNIIRKWMDNRIK